VQYLKGTHAKKNLFKRNEIVGPETYIDVDYVGSIVDRRSTTG
jgi:hypothetical protein